MNAVHHTKTKKLLEGAPVNDLKFNLFVAQIEQLQKNQSAEEDQRIDRFSPRVALPILRVALLE